MTPVPGHPDGGTGAGAGPSYALMSPPSAAGEGSVRPAKILCLAVVAATIGTVE
ncbi:hypothetical protein EV385_3607 [Krasilnikovia cinnamomea]|uniref:Uncharacterized protein n=1 Tax=Krasilnikovia cinnamomea TaxID=349313 RepID=A0A4Q7ZMW8_9ACTN|nr:hypothetical protein EV385_3607 [Krasilnikovia cinnamomea]